MSFHCLESLDSGIYKEFFLLEEPSKKGNGSLRSCGLPCTLFLVIGKGECFFPFLMRNGGQLPDGRDVRSY